MKTAFPYMLSAGSVVVALCLLYSGIYCYDRATWMMEIAPILIVFPLLWRTYHLFPLTTFLYLLIVLHSIVLIVGGMYTYARVPFGFELAHWLGSERNPYDKIGHFMQGFVPFIAAREILIRGKFVNGKKMLSFLGVCIVLAISATYELIEWGAAVALGQGADEFLGTQGYIWDTQSDMLFALIGAVTALVLFSRVHDRMIETRDHDENPR